MAQTSNTADLRVNAFTDVNVNLAGDAASQVSRGTRLLWTHRHTCFTNGCSVSYKYKDKDNMQGSQHAGKTLLEVKSPG